MLDRKQWLDLIEDSLPMNAFEQVPYVHVPATHAKALRLDVPLVTGIRGAGKTFWWRALQNDESRAVAGRALNLSDLADRTVSVVGYGEDVVGDDATPSKKVMSALLKKFTAETIWRGIILWKFKGVSSGMPEAVWSERLAWLDAHPEEEELLIRECHHEFEEDGKIRLLLFDALDRTAVTWVEMNTLLRGLLQTVLSFSAYRSIRFKIFVRPDMLEDPSVIRFPDASKLLQSKAELKWPALELYRLLWTSLANGKANGEKFRQYTEGKYGFEWDRTANSFVMKNLFFIREEQTRALFHELTGPWMGRDRRRGFPYTWLPSHLGDAHGQVSPRSFIAALRKAAEDSQSHEFKYPLYYQSIKRGVQEASKIRVNELKEDFPWIDTFLAPLTNAQLTIPVNFDEIDATWRRGNVFEGLDPFNADENDIRLPPPNLDIGSEGIRRDLEEMGIFQNMKDGRINMPDVYRVGFGLKRRGGVKPIR